MTISAQRLILNYSSRAPTSSTPSHISSPHPHPPLLLPSPPQLSMFPLLERDGLSIVYAALWVMWGAAMWPWAVLVQQQGACGGSRCGDLGQQEGWQGEGEEQWGAASSEAAGGGVSRRTFRPKDGSSTHKQQGSAVSGQAQGVRVGAGSLPWWVGLVVCAAVGALHAGKALVAPPERLPWLWDRIFITVSFVGLVLCWVYLNVRQWSAQAAGSKKMV